MTKKNKEDLSILKVVDTIVEGIQEKKGSNITVLDLTSVENTITSYFVICEGESNVHADAVAEAVEQYVKEQANEKPFHVEGKENAQWILIDYLDIVVHVFQKPTRKFYNLETLWADAPRTDIAALD
ncbi:ribosome silencing factor [Marinilabiliaceae bacterium ANBcel2]|nr:ribosome silencing factor [Marinilabiliaceae bacterium ANBcel2]